MAISTIGKRVRYKKPGKEFRGRVEDEVPFLEEYQDEDFLDLIQYIRWDDGSYGIRFCYYVKEHRASDDAWIFANRPLSTSPGALEKLLEKASKKKWFATII
jgi:hypothetical protein